MARTLLAIYPKGARRYDEMLSADGEVRPHWKQFFNHLDSVSPDEMHRRLEFVDRRILENGVTYNVYADPNGSDRPWACLLYTSPSPRDRTRSRMPSSA